MVVQAKKLIKEAENKVSHQATISFVTSDVDIVLKPLI